MKKSPKKSILGILAALLLIIGAATGVLPMDDIQGADLASTLVTTLQDEADEAAPALTDAPTEKPTEKPTKAPTEKPTATPKPTQKPTEAPSGPITDPQGIADYIFEHGCLPDNFITKAEAQALGWDSSYNDVSDVAPGMSIGGDRFGNYEGLLPKAKGRTYYEADCYYTTGNRNAHRIVFSNDGLVFYTSDHYESFVEMHPSK